MTVTPYVGTQGTYTHGSAHLSQHSHYHYEQCWLLVFVAVYCDNIRQTCCLHLQGSRQQAHANNGTCFCLMLMTCCAYSCTQYGLHTQYLHLTGADGLLCLQQNHYNLFLFILPRFSFGSPLSLPTNTAQYATTLPIFCYVTAWQIMVLHTILTSPDVTVQWQHYSDNIQTTGFKCLAVKNTHTHTHTHTHTQPSPHTQYMLLTHAHDLLCLQLHTVRSPHTVHASNPCPWLAMPTAAHSRSWFLLQL
jgi:hypothetical protein